MKYALVRALVPISDDTKTIPGEWFDYAPIGSYFAADIVTKDDDLKAALDSSGMAMMRKVNSDGLPRARTP